MAANVVPVSFKNNAYERYMYSYLKIKSSPSSYVKEMLEKDEGFIEYMCTVDKEYALRCGKKVQEESKPTSEVTVTETKSAPVNNIVNMSSICK